MFRRVGFFRLQRLGDTSVAGRQRFLPSGLPRVAVGV